MIRMRTFDKDLRPGPGLRSVTSVLVGSIQHYFFLLVLDIGSQIRESSFRKFFNILVSFCYIGNYFSLFTTNIFSLLAPLCTRLCEEHIRRIVLDKKINKWEHRNEVMEGNVSGPLVPRQYLGLKFQTIKGQYFVH